MQRLIVSGFVLIAAGLILLAYSDPILRQVLLGISATGAAPTSGFSAASAGGARFGGGATGAGAGTTFRVSSLGGGGGAGNLTDAMEALFGFGLSAVGLIVAVTGLLVRSRA